MYKLLIISSLFVIASVSSCKQKTPVQETVVVDTVKVIEKVEVPETEKPTATAKPKIQQPDPTPTPKPEPPVAVPALDWRVMLKEYHILLCKEYRKNGTNDDKIRQVELGKQLKDVPKTLSKSDKFYFTTEMARTLNMESCK